MIIEQEQLFCEECGWSVANPIEHAYETGHRIFKYWGRTKEDDIKENEEDGQD